MVGNIVIVYVVNLVGMMSPGPDFFIIVRNSMENQATFRNVVFTSLGIAIGCVFHVSFAIFGVTSLSLYVSNIFWVLKIGGGLYLFYLGATTFYRTFLGDKNPELLENASHLLLSKEDELQGEKIQREKQFFKHNGKQKTVRKAFTEGFLCNILNAKAVVFFASIFSQIIEAERSFWVDLNYVIGIPFMAFIWFSFLARLLTVGVFQSYFKNYQIFIGRVMGVLLMGLAGISFFA